MKIVGERAMIQFLDGVDDIRKAKIKEFYEKAEIKAKARPEVKPAAAKGRPAGTGGSAGATTRPTSMRPGVAKPGQLKRPSSTISVDKEPDSPKKIGIARPGVKNPGQSSSAPVSAAPSRLAHRQSMAAPPSARAASPVPPKKSAVEEPVAPKLGRGLMGRVSSFLGGVGLMVVYSCCEFGAADDEPGTGGVGYLEG